MDKQVLENHTRIFIRIFGKEDIEWKKNKANSEDGLLPRSIRFLWQKLLNDKINFTIKASFFEIYNDQVYDLLSSKREILNVHFLKDVYL